MPALRARSRSDRPAKPSWPHQFPSCNEDRIACRASARFAPVGHLTELYHRSLFLHSVKIVSSDAVKREQPRQRSPSSSRLRMCISGLRRANGMPGISPTGFGPQFLAAEGISPELRCPA